MIPRLRGRIKASTMLDHLARSPPRAKPIVSFSSVYFLPPGFRDGKISGSLFLSDLVESLRLDQWNVRP